jgi:transposase-like protein
MDRKTITKEEIIAEYLTGNISYRALEKKYGVPSRSICDWVLKCQGRLPSWRNQANSFINAHKYLQILNT